MAIPSLTDLRAEVCRQNQRIPTAGLAALTWGNVSGVDRDAGLYVIKPSGVAYEDLTPDLLVPVDLETGQVLAGSSRPSVDSESHRLLYREWPQVGGITHTHSTHAVAFAQARCPIPVLGTTHADTFAGPVPVTRDLSLVECGSDYEGSTARAVVEAVGGADRVPQVPAALAAQHGPFAWGADATASLDHPIVCEAVAEMALKTLSLHPDPLPNVGLFKRHFTRKHGPDAYYGNAKAHVGTFGA